MLLNGGGCGLLNRFWRLKLVSLDVGRVVSMVLGCFSNAWAFVTVAGLAIESVEVVLDEA